MKNGLSRDLYTEEIFNNICFNEPVEPDSYESVAEGIKYAMELDSKSAFLSGLSERLCQLGVKCTVDDTEIMRKEIKRRFKDILHITCPKPIKNWIRGTTPGETNRRNNYELCYALEMDFEETAVFFQKHFLTIPFNAKSKVDAVFMYSLYHKKPYSVAARLLEKSEGFVLQENAHTSTAQIVSEIYSEDDDDKFLKYLSEHCYGNEQQFQLARQIILSELEITREDILKYNHSYEDNLSPDRLGSVTIDTLLGYKYQNKTKRIKKDSLPKRFTESLPNDTTLGKIIRGETASYELLRKTMVLLKFYNFYFEADNCDKKNIHSNFMDFSAELNSSLVSCGFAQLYVCHPFDCLIIYCANSYEPIDALYCITANKGN